MGKGLFRKPQQDWLDSLVSQFPSGLRGNQVFWFNWFSCSRHGLGRTLFTAQITRLPALQEAGRRQRNRRRCPSFSVSTWTRSDLITEVWELLKKVTYISLWLLSAWLSTKLVNKSTKNIERFNRCWRVSRAPAAQLVPYRGYAKFSTGQHGSFSLTNLPGKKGQ